MAKITRRRILVGRFCGLPVPFPGRRISGGFRDEPLLWTGSGYVVPERLST